MDMVITSDDQNIIHAWDLSTANELYRIPKKVNADLLVFDFQGKYAAAAMWDGEIIIWDALTGRQIAQKNIGVTIYSLSFTDDNAHLMYSASDEPSIIIWEFTTDLESSLSTADIGNYFADFTVSRDGKWLAADSYTEPVRLIDISSGTEINRLINESTNGVEFSDDGKWIGFFSNNDLKVNLKIRRWNTQDLIEELCLHLPRNFTHVEWKQYFVDEPYQATCPNLTIPID